MAEEVGCAHPLRSFRLPSVAEPSPADAGGSPSYIHFALRIKRMAEGVGFEPTSRFTGSGFQDRRLKPLGHPSAYSRYAQSAKRLAFFLDAFDPIQIRSQHFWDYHAPISLLVIF